MKSGEKDSLSGRVQLTVRPEVDKVTRVEFSTKSGSVKAGQKLDLSQYVKVLPENATNSTVTYTVAPDYASYAEIDSARKTAKRKAEGTATITVKSV